MFLFFSLSERAQAGRVRRMKLAIHQRFQTPVVPIQTSRYVACSNLLDHDLKKQNKKKTSGNCQQFIVLTYGVLSRTVLVGQQPSFLSRVRPLIVWLWQYLQFCPIYFFSFTDVSTICTALSAYALPSWTYLTMYSGHCIYNELFNPR